MFPVAFSIGPLTVYSYPLFLLGAFVVAWAVVRVVGPSRGIPSARAFDLVCAAGLGGIVGARVWYVLSNLGEFAGAPQRVLMLQNGGLVFFGGLAGGALAVGLVARAEGLDRLAVTDTAAFALPLAAAVGRLGCFAAGCCAGLPCAGPLAVMFPGSSAAVWPTQLIDAVANLLVFGAVVAVSRAASGRRGAATWAYVAAYPVARFLVEALRAEPRVFGGLTQAQLVSALALPIGLAGLLFVFTEGRRRAEA